MRSDGPDVLVAEVIMPRGAPDGPGPTSLGPGAGRLLPGCGHVARVRIGRVAYGVLLSERVRLAAVGVEEGAGPGFAAGDELFHAAQAGHQTGVTRPQLAPRGAEPRVGDCHPQDLPLGALQGRLRHDGTPAP